MVYLILLFLAYGIEPAVQYILFDNIFERKFEKKHILLCWSLSYIMLCIKQILSFKKDGVEVIFYILVIAFYIYSCYYLFECKLNKIIIYVGILLVFAMLSDCLTFALFKVIGMSISNLNMMSWLGITVTYISKIFYMVFSYLLYKYRNGKVLNSVVEMIEVVLFLFGIIAFEMPTIVLFNNMKLISNNDSALLLFTASQIMLLLIVVYFLYVVNKHRSVEKTYEMRLEKDVAKFEAYEDINKLVEELRELRHDFKFHTCTLQGLYEQKRYEELGLYINQLRNNVKPAEGYIILDNKAVSGLLNQKIKEMDIRKIDFQHIIGISDFVMNDIDICSLLGNILDNAIEAAEKAKKKVVSIKIIYESIGYKILCKNTYLTPPVFIRGNYITTKQNSNKHGFGVKIIRKIVENHKGMVKIETVGEWFVLSVFIPYKEDKL